MVTVIEELQTEDEDKDPEESDSLVVVLGNVGDILEV